MRKKVLFVMNNLHCGGAEKALISLLETFNYDVYDVDVMLFQHEGLFMSSLSKRVRLLEEPGNYRYFDMSMKQALLDSVKKRDFVSGWNRLRSTIVFRMEKNKARAEQRVWKYIAPCLPQLETHYDVAIGFLEKTPIYYCIDNVKATTKIGFIHNDYDKLGMDASLDKAYFDQLTYIATVSAQCKVVLQERFPQHRDKIKCIHNIVSPSIIHTLSLTSEFFTNEGAIVSDEVSLISVGRLTTQKGFDIAIEACKTIVEQGYNLKWYIIGEGEDRDELTALIERYGLQEHFILLGIKSNPYPYMKRAHIYVQPSRFEGKSIAIDEAKILQKPIVVTNFSTVGDQIVHEQNGLIAQMNHADLAAQIVRLIHDERLRKRLVKNLAAERLGTESEINKLYALMG